MDLGLAGKVAIVTGASDGIGKAAAARFAAEGASVALGFTHGKRFGSSCGRDSAAKLVAQ